MPWFWFVAMLITLVVSTSYSQNGQGAGALMEGNSPAWGTLLGPLLVALLSAKAWMIYLGRFVATADLSVEGASRLWEIGRRVFTAIGVGAVIATGVLTGFIHRISGWRETSDLMATLASIIPLVLLAILMDCLDLQWEQFKDDLVEPSEDSKTAQSSFAFRAILRELWSRATWSWLLPLIPILVSSVGIDILKLFFSELALQKWSWLFISLLSVVVSLCVGTILLTVCTVRCDTTSGSPKQWLRLLESIGIKVQGLRVWNTQGRISNAFLVGIFPWQRYIILTDRLVKTLSPRELEMVLLHEAAHAKRGHGAIRFIAMLVWGLTLLIGIQSLSPLSALWEGLLSGGIVLVKGRHWQDVLILLGGVMWVVTGALGIRWLWHSTEFDADQVACQLAAERRVEELKILGCVTESSQEYKRECWKAAMDLAAALHNLAGSSTCAARDNWTHPSVLRRTAALSERYAEPVLSASVRPTL